MDPRRFEPGDRVIFLIKSWQQAFVATNSYWIPGRDYVKGVRYPAEAGVELADEEEYKLTSDEIPQKEIEVEAVLVNKTDFDVSKFCLYKHGLLRATN